MIFMKNKSLIPEILIFFLIFICIIVPPFFSAPLEIDRPLFTWTFPYRQLGLALFCLVLFIMSRELNTKKGFFFPGLFSLTFMFMVALLIKYFTKNAVPAYKNPLPDTNQEWFFCILTFIFSATYEEIIYRFYFSDALKRLIEYSPLRNQKLIYWISEIAGYLVFAFAHLYLGFAAVINAACAHWALRFLYKKTNFIWNCVLVHFLYNIISLILL